MCLPAVHAALKSESLFCVWDFLCQDGFGELVLCHDIYYLMYCLRQTYWIGQDGRETRKWENNLTKWKKYRLTGNVLSMCYTHLLGLPAHAVWYVATVTGSLCQLQDHLWHLAVVISDWVCTHTTDPFLFPVASLFLCFGRYDITVRSDASLIQFHGFHSLFWTLMASHCQRHEVRDIKQKRGVYWTETPLSGGIMLDI